MRGVCAAICDNHFCDALGVQVDWLLEVFKESKVTDVFARLVPEG